jgi:signal transduction histidine kinase/CheY-like chemotaxis protein
MPAKAKADAQAADMRVLVIPPTSADAVAISKLLGSAAINYQLFPNMNALCNAVGAGVGVAIVSEEVLIAEIDRLARCISEQPVWSDVPIIVLSRSGTESTQLSQAVQRIGNVSVVERPVRVTTLISLIHSALRARGRQYQVRDQLVERDFLFESERQARAVAEHAGRMKDEFLATLSHELRTPLNAMLGWSQLLRSMSGLPGDVEEGLTIIERNARAQTQIIEDLLDMSRIISGKVRLDIQPADLSAIVIAAMETVRPMAQAKGVRLKLDVDSAPPPVQGDPGRLQQVYWNLLTNAVKFTPRDGQVTVTMRSSDGQVQVSITDTGEGIDPEFLPHVFDRFRQADASTTRKHGGLGLGLSIVKQLVELHGGTVAATSAGSGTGSTFRVNLPVTASNSEPPPAQPNGAAVIRKMPGVVANSLNKVDLRGVKVLIVDDEDDARSLLKRLLQERGADVVIAASVVEAADLFPVHRPDVILTDIGMPREDGYSLIRRVRALTPEAGGRTPAIALTAYARAEDRIRAINAGFQLHMAKPVEPVELIAMVASLAARDGQRVGSRAGS